MSVIIGGFEFGYASYDSPNEVLSLSGAASTAPTATGTRLPKATG
jgi:hypothetical protein